MKKCKVNPQDFTASQIIEAMKVTAKKLEGHYAWFNDGKDETMVKCRLARGRLEWSTVDSAIRLCNEATALKTLKAIDVTPYTPHSLQDELVKVGELA